MSIKPLVRGMARLGRQKKIQAYAGKDPAIIRKHRAEQASDIKTARKYNRSSVTGKVHK